MAKTPAQGRGLTRRQFIKGASLGVAGAVAATTIVGRLFPSLFGRRSAPPVFPEGSIYTPDPKRLKRL